MCRLSLPLSLHQVAQMMETVRKIGKAMESKSVEGETVVAQAPGGATMMVAK